jgi:sec-independent protein translocase protein TatA
MGSISIWHWLIVGALALILFGGKGKISDLMGDVAKGIKSFKKGMAEDDDKAPQPAAPVEQPRTIDQQPAAPVAGAPQAAPHAPAQSSQPGKVG